jgi:F-type H+-transporting ATPase subunit epsilon
MTQKLQFELVSPEQKIISEDIAMVVIPGTEGDFGVLAGHMPLVATVRTGVVEIYRTDKTKCDERIFIAGGFADVSGTGCSLLAEQAINVNDIDKANIQKQISDIQSHLSTTQDSAEQKVFHKKLDILNAMLQSAA